MAPARGAADTYGMEHKWADTGAVTPAPVLSGRALGERYALGI